MIGVNPSASSLSRSRSESCPLSAITGVHAGASSMFFWLTSHHPAAHFDFEDAFARCCIGDDGNVSLSWSGPVWRWLPYLLPALRPQDAGRKVQDAHFDRPPPAYRPEFPSES
jgi:hypothetical protein